MRGNKTRMSGSIFRTDRRVLGHKGFNVLLPTPLLSVHSPLLEQPKNLLQRPDHSYRKIWTRKRYEFSNRGPSWGAGEVLCSLPAEDMRRSVTSSSDQQSASNELLVHLLFAQSPARPADNELNPYITVLHSSIPTYPEVSVVIAVQAFTVNNLLDALRSLKDTADSFNHYYSRKKVIRDQRLPNFEVTSTAGMLRVHSLERLHTLDPGPCKGPILRTHENTAVCLTEDCAMHTPTNER